MRASRPVTRNGSSMRGLRFSQRAISRSSLLHWSHIGCPLLAAVINHAAGPRSFLVFDHFEKAEDFSASIENSDRLAGVFDKLHRKLERFVGIREIVNDHGNLGLVSDPRAVKLLLHGRDEKGASHW